MKWLRPWAGGRVRELNDGTLRYYIQRRLGGGVRKNIALDVETETEALAELALFNRDPAGYQTRKQVAQVKESRSGAKLDPDTYAAFLKYAFRRVEKGELTDEYVKQTYAPYLKKWGEALGGKPLRKVTLDELKAHLKKWPTARHARIVALKAFTAWLREEADVKLHRSEDPTIDLKTPPIVPAKHAKPKGYPVALVEKLYASLPSQAARDMICLRAKANGVHNTEIQRIAEGKATLIRVSDPSGIEGVIVFDHLKKGKQHAVSVDEQTFEAALRLRARKSALSRNAMKQMLDLVVINWHGCDGISKQRINKHGERVWSAPKPCKDCSPIHPGELRHSFATWAVTIGEEVNPTNQKGVDLAKVSEAMGHLGKRTTAVFYVGDRVPMMIRIPIRLVHPEDPRPIARKERKEQAG